MSNLLLTSAASGVIRNQHLIVPNGATLAERALLLELAGVNLALRSEELGTAPWGFGSSLAIAADAIEAPDGTLTADRLSNDGTVSSQGFSQAITFTADGVKVFSVFLKAGTAAATAFSIYDQTAATHRHVVQANWTNGVPSLVTGSGAGLIFPPRHIRNGWYRCAFNASGVVAANANVIVIYPSGTGAVAGSVYAWGAQPENARVPSSYMKSVGTQGTRAAETWSRALPALNPPRACSVYMRQINQGHGYLGSTAAWWIGDAAFTQPLLYLSDNGTFDGRLFGQWHDGSSASTSVMGTGPTVGDVLEAVVQLSAGGACQLLSAINGGAIQTAAAGAAVPLSVPFVTPVRLNLQGPAAFTHVAVADGVYDLPTMRRLAGVR